MTSPIQDAPPPHPGEPAAFSEFAASALRYWEPRRLIYNLALSGVVGLHFLTTWPHSRTLVTRDNIFVLFLLAVVANILYCVAYAVDLFVQFSAVRDLWPRRRWIVLLTGTAFAAVIAHFVTLGLLESGGVRR